MSNSEQDYKKIQENLARYKYGISRGHTDYCRHVKKCEDFYLGKQWSQQALDILLRERRPALTFNQIAPKINAAIGYQIHNRADISFKPRTGASDDVAWTLSKLVMQIDDNTNGHWKETQIFSDGLIQQRGYYDIRISYDDTILGEVSIHTLDPLDVIPDPDAKSYDPDEWADVIITRWVTEDEIKSLYGEKASKEVKKSEPNDFDYNYIDESVTRNSFAENENTIVAEQHIDEQGVKRYRVIDRQYWKTEKTEVLITPTGDIRPAFNITDQQRNNFENEGYFFVEQKIKRVRWLVTTEDKVLFDDWSPFNHFTVVPYFPFFRRGKTRGLVDAAIDPQQMFNKAMSQYLHVINSSSNGGTIFWGGTVANMTDDELADTGAMTGRNIILKKETEPNKFPQKIQPNPVPTGIDRVMDRAQVLVSDTTGVSDAMQGIQGQEISGVAIQSRQFAAQQQLAMPLDNLAETRRLKAIRILELIQTYYDLPRIVRITEKNQLGQDQSQDIYLNYPIEEGKILNDLTVGEYDVVIDEVPMQITFENSQFNQLLEIAQKLPQVVTPDFIRFIVSHSNITDKQEMIEALSAQQEPQTDPVAEAKAQQILAQTEKLKAESEKIKADSVNKGVEAVYSGVQAANVIASLPQTAPIADQLLKSAGYVDKDEAPIVATPNQEIPNAELANPTNTNPLTPANPDVGIMQGIRTPQID